MSIKFSYCLFNPIFTLFRVVSLYLKHKEMNMKKATKQNPQKFNNKRLLWSILGVILGIIIVSFWLVINIIENHRDVGNRALGEHLTSNYDFDLELIPQNCDGVSGKVDIVLITDANYMDFTRVAINSAKQTKCPLSSYHFYVMTLDVSDADVNALKALEDKNVEVTVLPQKEADLFYIRDTHVSKTSLLKYYIPNTLPQLDKVLYIDSDILVLRDLNKLYNTDITGKYLAAVKDPSWFFENTHVLELNLEKRGFYFNSGVMLLNLKKFRKDNLIQKLEDYTNNNFRTYMDQDALNVVVGNDVVLMDFENNAINFFFEHVDLATMAQFYDRHWHNYVDVFAPATIIHFASSKKPLGTVASKDEFFYMLQKLWYKYYTPLPPLD